MEDHEDRWKRHTGSILRGLLAIGVLLAFSLFIAFEMMLSSSDHEKPWSTLSVGEEVISLRAFRASPANEVVRGSFYENRHVGYKCDYDYENKGSLEVAAGTTGVVTIDTRTDDDDTNDRRPIAVTLCGGVHQGLTVALPRNGLKRNLRRAGTRR